MLRHVSHGKPATAHGALSEVSMADIKNYPMYFGCGRSLDSLDFAAAKTACAEIERGLWVAH